MNRSNPNRDRYGNDRGRFGSPEDRDRQRYEAGAQRRGSTVYYPGRYEGDAPRQESPQSRGYVSAYSSGYEDGYQAGTRAQSDLRRTAPGAAGSGGRREWEQGYAARQYGSRTPHRADYDERAHQSGGGFRADRADDRGNGYERRARSSLGYGGYGGYGGGDGDYERDQRDAGLSGYAGHTLDRAGFRRVGPKNYVRSDDRLREAVCERLAHRDHLDVSEVSVDVQSGVVTLEGHVTDRRMKYEIEDIVDDTFGVSEVVNRLHVRPYGVLASE
ncbi:BON domain-containing protein [Cupriavidus plantarum]|uniref:BON domain-containing protein n=1 Tax=Cupriavidus plantarum TaxID=942865 RepID=UPI000E2643B0|nr:BON domain-containing protein [Cupriavidus plantarum]REE91204.1 BON domain-containing protein [Cupriavidus plantarum]